MLQLISPEDEGLSIHNGFPNAAIDQIIPALDLNQLLIANRLSTYFMSVVGDSWQYIGIFSGDIVVVDRTATSRLTEMLVWHRNDELTLSFRSKVPSDAVIWGGVTAVVHRYTTR